MNALYSHGFSLRHIRLNPVDRSRRCTLAMSRVREMTVRGPSPYAPVVALMKSRYDIRIKKWRRTMSGCAWRVYHADGRVVNWIEAPVPRTPISLAIFLHEVGHHVIGFDRYKRRCEEEYHVWIWALDQMKELGITLDERVNRRFALSMEYAVGKAVRRGLKILPEPLMQFLPAA